MSDGAAVHVEGTGTDGDSGAVAVIVSGLLGSGRVAGDAAIPKVEGAAINKDAAACIAILVADLANVLLAISDSQLTR